MYYRTDDPARDYEAYDAEQQRKLEKLPKCCICEEPIVQEYAVKIDDNWYCDECLEDKREYIPEFNNDY